MLNYELKIGLLPIRRDLSARPGIFNWEIAEERCCHSMDFIRSRFSDEQTSFVDLKGINEAGVLFNEKDVSSVVERFSREKVDAVVVINGNFGNEEVVALVTKALGVPVLLWGPADDRFDADGSRYTDTQCGLFGISRSLQRYGVPFTYIENCKVEDECFVTGMKRFLSVACMVKNFHGMKIGQIGMRPQPFGSVIYNEGELLQKFGVRVIPINLAVVIGRYNQILAEKDQELEAGAKLLRSRYTIDQISEDNLKKIYAFVLLYQALFEEYRLNAVAAECWTAMMQAVGAMPCAAYSVLADMGYVISCETDVHGAISMALLTSAARGKKTAFFGEFTVRHPQNKNAELLWHCGPFAYSLKKPGTESKIVNMREWLQVKDGKYTIARMDQDNGRYSLIGGKFASTDGPYTFGTYVWAEFEDLSAWEKKLIEGPYIHHMAEIEGDYTEELKEFCKYIPELAVDQVK